MKKCVIIMNPESGKKHRIKNYNTFYDVLLLFFNHAVE